MLTSAQIRNARTLLGWSRGQLGRTALLRLDILEQAEERDGTALLTYGQEIAIRRVCGQAGVAFVDEPPTVRWRDGARGRPA